MYISFREGLKKGGQKFIGVASCEGGFKSDDQWSTNQKVPREIFG